MERQDFYVYTYEYRSVFYVGKGRKDRILFHEKEACKGHQCQRCDFIRKIIAQGGEIIKTKVYEHLSEAEAFRLEAQVIELHGYANLMNRQRGHTREFRRRGKFMPQYGQITTINQAGLYSITEFRLDIPGDREKAVAMLQGTFEEVVEIPV